MSAVRVLNLMSESEQYYTCDPRSAVICAYAQSLNDWNTWDYEKKYGNLVLEGKYTFSCGDFCAKKDGVNYGRRTN